MKKTLLMLAVFLLAVPLLVWADPIVNNGSFEAQDFGFQTLGFGCQNVLVGWSAHCSADSIYPWGTKNSSYNANSPVDDGANDQQFVILGDFGTGGGSWIEQSVGGFTPGNTYSLNFWLASEEPGSNSTICVQVSMLSGTCAAGTIFSAPATPGNYWQAWEERSLTFIAAAGTEIIHFEGEPNPISLDTGLDDVSITSSSAAVPEPSSLLLLGSGLAGLAGVVRKKLAKTTR